MKYFSMFSGVEGFGQGFPKKWECVGFSEVDKYASMVLKYHFPKVKNYGDITRIKWEKVAEFDILTGGSPCQDFSIAGKRRGLSGSRSSLVWEYIRCLRTKKPRYFIWENVKGVVSSRGGWDFANILSAFSESGYALWWQVLNAKDFGVPQNRERIFVIGFRKENPKEIFFEREISENFNESEWKFSSDEAEGGGKYSFNFNSKNGEDGKRGQLYQINNPTHSNDRVYDPKGISPTLNTMEGGNRQPFIVAQRGRNPQNPKSRKSGLPTKQMLEPNLKGISNTLSTVEKDNYVYDGRIRKLMPIECERLMSWQDNWTKWGIDEKGNKVEISDSQRYRQCGNGVVSNVIKEIVKYLICENIPSNQ